MSGALTILAYVSIFAAFLWVPYILGAFFTRGFGILGYPVDLKPLPAWAKRAERAHLNLLENLPPFAALVIVAEFAKADAAATAMWASVFLVARLIHWLVFVLKIPVLRTLAFVAGFVAQLMIFLQIMSATDFALPVLPF
ncbi:MAG: MAPEG family protein [Pseudomonadota bacterium]